MGFLELIGLRPAGAEQTGPSEASQTIRRITESLDKMDPQQAKYVASFAYILGRVAHADLNISEQETREMERIVQGLGGLPEEQAILVVQIAKTQNTLFGSTENFVVTREFNNLASRAQKLAVLQCLFAVSSSDQVISTTEDNEIRKISSELKLDHRDFIAARSAYRQYLGVLKDSTKR
jgi:uncharacterized tellurite resistance protein B-like protein